MNPTAINPNIEKEYSKTFSICTLVNDKELYDEMVMCYKQMGFDDDCEFLFIDNTETNQTCAYQGLNTLIDQSSGKYIILCHQDILVKNHRSILEERLSELDKIDPRWAIVGNAGGICLGEFAAYLQGINDNDFLSIGKFPHGVQTLDEDWMLLKSSARIGFSANLSGFHFYGADICLQANIRGNTCYVIQFLVQHKGKCDLDDNFYQCLKDIKKKYTIAFRNRTVQTTCTDFEINII